MKYKILNLYACLGGNRYKWDEVAEENGVEIEITAVELDEELAKLYQERFSNDIVVVADAHQYLLDHYKEFDFIWSSPPCPTHSKMNHIIGGRGTYRFPDMKLYEEIIFLSNFFKGKYCVENVVPYYEPLIKAQKRGRHLYWANFKIPINISNRKSPILTGKCIDALCKFHDYDFYKYNGVQHRGKISRNLVDYEAGKTILETALGIIKDNNKEQIKLF